LILSHGTASMQPTSQANLGLPPPTWLTIPAISPPHAAAAKARTPLGSTHENAQQPQKTTTYAFRSEKDALLPKRPDLSTLFSVLTIKSSKLGNLWQPALFTHTTCPSHLSIVAVMYADKVAISHDKLPSYKYTPCCVLI
jgi:hypothetical protein